MPTRVCPNFGAAVKEVAILLYEGFTALDAVGPYEIFASLPDTKVTFVATERGEVRSDTLALGLIADASLEDCPNPDIIVLPGGASTPQAASDERIINWIKNAHQSSLYTTSVCTGAYLLGKAGLLKGMTMTTHWASKDYVGALCGAQYKAERFIENGKILTAAGVSAGIDMALYLAAKLTDQAYAEAVQLALEYDPQPPFHEGAISSAKESTVEKAKKLLYSRPDASFRTQKGT